MKLYTRSKNQSLIDRIITSIRWRLLSPKKPKVVKNNLPLISLGSKYGRKTFCDIFPIDKKLQIISAGVGEDISFDIEFLNRFKAVIILVDPTPVAIQHFEMIKDRIGLDSIDQYSPNSRQSANSYSLIKVTEDNLILAPQALWKDQSLLHFHLPPDDSRDSSGSINSIHNFYRASEKQITVQTTTVLKICEENDFNEIDILKLDIEGSALEVLVSMFFENIYPIQILLEIDEIHFPSFRSKYRAFKLFKILKKNRYIIVNQDSCDFTFVRNEYIK
jgi:FkbM family methyltransferase